MEHINNKIILEAGEYVFDKENGLKKMTQDKDNELFPDGTLEYVADGQVIWRTAPNGRTHIFANIRGWGYLTGGGACNLPHDKAVKIQNEWAETICRLWNTRANVPNPEVVDVDELNTLLEQLENSDSDVSWCGKGGLHERAAAVIHNLLSAPVVPDGWQPIETAPHKIPFIANGKTEIPCVVTRTNNEYWGDDYPFCCYHTQVVFHKSKFTHWIPLTTVLKMEIPK